MKPNFLIVMTDHQRSDTLLHPAKITPRADAFAQEGILFSEAYCPSPHCCPARATFFQGFTHHDMESGIISPTLKPSAVAPFLK